MNNIPSLVLWFMAAKLRDDPNDPSSLPSSHTLRWLYLHGMGQGYHHVLPVANYTLNPKVRNGFCSDFVTFSLGPCQMKQFQTTVVYNLFLWLKSQFLLADPGFLAGYVLFCCLKTSFHFVAWFFFRIHFNCLESAPVCVW